MAARFTEDEILAATGASRVHGAALTAPYAAVCTDSRHLVPGCLFVALRGERFDAHDFLGQALGTGAAGAIVARGQVRPETLPPGALYEVKDPLMALGALARHHRRRFSIPVGAITGSNGKTTTKELVGSILEACGPALRTRGNLNNEVGLPLTLLELEAGHQAAVVELGMNHAGEIRRMTAIAEPTAGLVTCIQPVHLEGLGTLEHVALAKGELFEGLAASATAVVNADDPLVMAQAPRARGGRLTFGRSAAADVRLVSAEPNGRDGLLLSVMHAGREWPVRLALLGAHNALNATGAFALGLALGVPPERCVAGLEAARGREGRLTLRVGTFGVTVLDDAYNANPSSMTAGLQTLAALAAQRGGRPVAVLGDMLELGQSETEAHAAMGAAAARYAEVVAFFGPRMRSSWANAKDALGPATAHFEETEPLLRWLRGWLRSNDLVLVKASRGMRLERVVEGLTGRAWKGGH